MRFVRRSYHTVIEIPITPPPGAYLPMLVIEDEVSWITAAWTRSLRQEGYSGSLILKAVKAVGYLYDYYYATVVKPGKTLQPKDLPHLLSNFVEARRRGTVHDGSDPTGLYWTSVREATVDQDLRYVTKFSDFCGQEFGHCPLNPIDRHYASTIRTYTNWREKTGMGQSRQRWDLLYHLSPARNPGMPRKVRSRGGRQAGVAKKQPFPRDKIFPLIRETKNIRDRMIWLLLAFGGIRMSELLHLYVTDIDWDHRRDTLLVRLADPEEGKYEWVDLQGRKRTGTREQYLQETFGRVPRTRLGQTHPEHAGWKGMLWDDANRMESRVWWLSQRAARLFWRLHQEYLTRIRLRIKNHPYYFVSLHADSYGEPLKRNNLKNLFAQACKRIRVNGYGIHTLRHFYGDILTDAGIKREYIQRFMHHRFITSSDSYRHLKESRLQEMLNAIYRRPELSDDWRQLEADL